MASIDVYSFCCCCCTLQAGVVDELVNAPSSTALIHRIKMNFCSRPLTDKGNRNGLAKYNSQMSKQRLPLKIAIKSSNDSIILEL